MKYTNKLRNMSKALADMGTDVLPNVGCAFIGLSEVENHKVLDALVDQAPLKARNMKYVHIEGPDRRGIDCALLYNPSLFSVKNVKLLPYVQELAKDSAFFTRGFLTVRGEMAGDDVAVIVCHWPSRFSGPFYRESAARQVKVIKDSLLNVNQEMKIFVMGDMNDDPVNKSMHVYLQAKPEISQVGAGDMYNPWYNVLAKEGKGGTVVEVVDSEGLSEVGSSSNKVAELTRLGFSPSGGGTALRLGPVGRSRSTAVQVLVGSGQRSDEVANVEVEVLGRLISTKRTKENDGLISKVWT